MITLASASDRLVALEALQQAQHEREAVAAIEGLTDEDALTLIILCYLVHDRPGPPVMDDARVARWLRAGLPALGLPRPLRPLLGQARAQAQRFIAAVEAGQPCGDEHTGWCVWLHDQGATAGAWAE